MKKQDKLSVCYEDILKAAREDRYEDVRKILSNVRSSERAMGKINSQGWTLLHSAADSGDCALVSILLSEYNVNPEPRDYDGLTPLMCAATQGFTEICRILADAGIEEYTKLTRIFREKRLFKFNSELATKKGQVALLQNEIAELEEDLWEFEEKKNEN